MQTPARTQLADELHAAVMNVPCDWQKCGVAGVGAALAYKQGHRDARHAAAEAISALASAEAVQWMDAERYRFLRDEGFLHRLVNVHPCDEVVRAQLTDASVDRMIVTTPNSTANDPAIAAGRGEGF